MQTTPATRTLSELHFLGFALEHEVSMLYRHTPEGKLPYVPPIWTRRVLVQLPMWFPTVLFAAYPIFAFIRGPLRRWRRRRKGLCITCGYDLTGNVSGVCPECGAEIKEL